MGRKREGESRRWTNTRYGETRQEERWKVRARGGREGRRRRRRRENKPDGGDVIREEAAGASC